MIDKFARPWVLAVFAAYLGIIVSLLVFVNAPWNWLIALLVTGKAAGFYVVIRRVAAIGTQPAKKPVRVIKPEVATEGAEAGSKSTL